MLCAVRGWLCVNLQPGIGGSQRHTQVLQRGLERAGVPSMLVNASAGLSDAELAEAERWHRAAGARFVRPPAAMNRRGFRRTRALARWYARRPEQIVNVNAPTLSGIGLPDVLAVRLARKRLILSIHHPADWSGHGLLGRAKVASVVALTDALVVSTPFMQADLEPVVPGWLVRRKVVVLAHASDPPPEGRRVDRLAARRALDLPADATVVVTVTRLVPHKRVEDVVRVCSRRAGLINVVAGDGPLREELERQADDTVWILGPVPDVHELLAAADLFVLVSEMEGFGLVYIEAAFHGVPSIGAAVGGVPWVIEHGVTGWLVPPCDVAALEAALDEAVADPARRQAMGERARSRALREFTGDAMAQRYLQVAARLVA